MLDRARSLRNRRPAVFYLAAFTVGILLCWPVVDFYLRNGGYVSPFGFNDFGAYSSALNRWAEGAPIYVQDDAGGYHGSYLYPPVTLLFFYPFATFGFVESAMLMNGLSLILLWLGLEAVARALGRELGLGARVVMLFALFGFQPALRDFKWAQVSTLLAALLCFAFYAHELEESGEGHGRWFAYASGALTTLASSFKLFVATSGAHLLRDRRRLAGALGTAVLLLAVSLLVFGLDAHRTYLDVLLWGKGWGERDPLYMWDTSAAYHPLYVFGGLGMVLRVLGLLAVIGITLATRAVDGVELRRSVFALGVAVVPLFAPSADSHDLIVLLVPAVILLAVEFDRPDGWPIVPVLSILLVHLHRYVIEVAINPPQWLPLRGFVAEQAAWFQPAMWATFLLVGLAAYRIVPHVPRLARDAPAPAGEA